MEFWSMAVLVFVPTVCLGLAMHMHYAPTVKALHDRVMWMENARADAEVRCDRLTLALRKAKARLDYTLVTSGEIMRGDLSPEEWAEAKLWGAERGDE